jgi:hypothetical protein
MRSDNMKCQECKQEKMLYSPTIRLCEDCYEDMFKGEPDFELENDVAVVNSNENFKGVLYIPSDQPAYLRSNIEFPKPYKVDFSKTDDKAMMLLLKALLSEMTFIDTHPHFEHIKKYLKEIK